MTAKILALETSGVACSVTTLEDGKLPKITRNPSGQRSAQALAPAIDRALRDASWRPDDIEVVAVTSGPGSFTGLRIGVTTAKAIAYATKAKITGVDTLAVIANQQTEPCEHLTVILDAYRGQLFIAEFCIPDTHTARRISDTRILDIDEVINNIPTDSLLTGPGLSRIRDRLPTGIRLAAESNSQPQAIAVAKLGKEKYANGQFDDLWNLAPRYFRRSAAEEKLE